MQRMYERVIFFFLFYHPSLITTSQLFNQNLSIDHCCLFVIITYNYHSRMCGTRQLIFRHGPITNCSYQFCLPRYGTKRTMWFHRRRTEHFLSPPMSLLHPTRLGESVRRYLTIYIRHDQSQNYHLHLLDCKYCQLHFTSPISQTKKQF